jgi:serine/threonine protein phosphatase PrpC
MILIIKMGQKLRVDSYGASVRGPLHRKEKHPNEDAWLHAKGAYGSLIVVCDGMGSRPQARHGAIAATAAVREAVSLWSQTESAPLAYLVHLIEVLWRLKIHPVTPADACTTCLMALARPAGEWVVGGIGDGLVLTRTGQELTIVIGDRLQSFGNETMALGVSGSSRAWNLQRLPPPEAERLVVLATDGVSDDLIPERLHDFCDWLVDDVHTLSPAQRWRLLVKELREWPTPRHLDDKTLAVLTTRSATIKETS